MKLRSCSKGVLAQLKVQFVCAQRNLTVSIPTNPESAYDILIDNMGNILRTQIKYCNRKHGTNKNNLELQLYNRMAKRDYYLKDEIDLLLVFLPKHGIILNYGPEEFHKKKTIYINLKNKNSKWYFKKHIW